MAVTEADIVFYKAAATTGGRKSVNVLTTGAKHALFPAITPDQRAAGGTRYRKIFVANENTENLAWVSAGPYIKTPSPAGDYLRLHLGTKDDDATAAAAYTDWAGAGALAAAASPGATSLTVDFDAADGVWDGAVIVISEGSVREEAEVDGAPAWTGNQAVLTLAGAITGDFTTAAIVSTVPGTETVKAAFDTWVKTLTGTAAFDHTQAVAYNVGTVEDAFTLTFTDALGNFSVVGAYSGAVGTGSIGVDFQPAAASGYYMKLPAAAWSGDTPAMGDIVTFNMTESAQAVWIKNVWPAGVASYTANAPQLAWIGASE